MVVPHRHQLNLLFYRTRLIVLEEGIRMQTALREIENASQHTTILIHKLQDISLQEATRHITKLRETIMDCEGKNLKRLEAECRLVQLCFYITLKTIGKTSELEVNVTLQKTLDLCQTYPDTAGLLISTYREVKEAILQGRPSSTISTIYVKGPASPWWTWPKHQVGSLEHCKYGHPYSKATWAAGCPECGRETAKVEPVSPDDHLTSPQDFMKAMKTHTFRTVWR